MLTPRFVISQNSLAVIISIIVPHVRVVGNMEVYVDGRNFTFYCKPYLLKLVFPHELRSPEDDIETEADEIQMDDKKIQILEERKKSLMHSSQSIEMPLSESKIQPLEDKDNFKSVENAPSSYKKEKKAVYKVVYDPDKDNGTVTIHLEKATRDQVFENLDLTTMLLQPKGVNPIPTIYDHVQRTHLTDLDVPLSTSSKIQEEMRNDKNLNKSKRVYETPLIEVLSSSSFKDGQENDKMEEENRISELPDKVKKETIIEEIQFQDQQGETDQAQDQREEEGSVVSEDSDEEGEDKVMSVRDFNILNKDTLSTQESRTSTSTHTSMTFDSGTDNNISINNEISDFNINIRATNYYGFNNQYCNVFKGLREDLVGVIRLEDPDATPYYMRPLSRIDDENKDFDVERYLGDFVGGEEDPLYQEAFQFLPFWHMQDNNISGGDTFELTLEDRMQLMDIKNKEYLVDMNRVVNLNGINYRPIPILLTLIDILLSYAYEHRTTFGEPTVESCWTLVSLSPAFSYLENYIQGPTSSQSERQIRNPSTLSYFSNLQEITYEDYKNGIRNIVLTFVRRCLIYPYLRNYTLAVNAIKDTSQICKLGKRALVHCLLSIKNIFERTENYYYLNKIVVDDYLCYVQKYDDMDQALQEVGDILKECFGGDDGHVSSRDTMETFQIRKDEITFNGDTIKDLEHLVEEHEEREGEDDASGSGAMDSDSDSDSDTDSDSDKSDSSSDKNSDNSKSGSILPSTMTNHRKLLIEEI